MDPVITAFAKSPDQGRGLARDMRVRWALEEVGRAYDVDLVSFAEMGGPDYRALNPFGQIPTFRHDGLTLFESGAIVLRIAERHPGLLPADPDARSRAIMWMFAALNTVEPPLFERSLLVVFDKEQPWFEARLAIVEGRVRKRLAELAAHLGDADWLDGAFGAGDLLMVAVLRMLKSSPLLDEHPTIAAYVARAEARPAFQRAFAAQKAVFEAAR